VHEWFVVGDVVVVGVVVIVKFVKFVVVVVIVVVVVDFVHFWCQSGGCPGDGLSVGHAGCRNRAAELRLGSSRTVVAVVVVVRSRLEISTSEL